MLDIENAISTLKSNPIFRMLGRRELESIAPRLWLQTFEAGDLAMEQGAASDGYHVILSGQARVIDVENVAELAILGEGDGFGERSLLYGQPSGAAIFAVGPLKTLKLPTGDFQSLIRENPRIGTLCAEAVQWNEEFNSLRTHELFSELEPEELIGILKKIERKNLKKGEWLFREGEEGDAAYIVRDGKIRIYEEHIKKTLAVSRAGAIIGERALIKGEPRMASAMAIEDASLFRLSRAAFMEALPKIEEAVEEILSNRALQYQAFSADAKKDGSRAAPQFFEKEIRIPRGLKKRRATITTVNRPELYGLASVETLARFMGVGLPEKWGGWVAARLSRGGSDNLVAASLYLEQMGFHTRKARIAPVDLEQASMPALFLDVENIPCALLAVGGGKAWIGHPEKGPLAVPIEKFREDWNGALLMASPVSEFAKAGKSVLSIYAAYLPLIRPFKNYFLWIVCMSVVLMLLGLAAPFFTQTIIDRVLVFSDKSLLKLMIVGMAVVSVFQLLGTALRSLLTVTAMQKLEAIITTRLFQHVISLPLHKFQKFRAGDYATRFEENKKLLTLVSESGLTLTMDVAAALYYLFLLFGRHPGMTALGLAFLMGFVLLMVVSSPMLRANDIKVFDATSSHASYLIDMLTGMQTIKSLAAEGQFFQDGLESLSKRISAHFTGVQFGYLVGLMSNILINGASLALLAYGSTLVMGGEMTVGEYVAFNAIYALLLAPVARLAGMWDKIQEIRVSYDRVKDILDIPPERSEQNRELSKIEGRIRVEGLSFRYEGAERDALSNVNLEIKAGQKVAFVGRSGCGKSTLINLILGFFEPTAGKVFIDDVDAETLNRDALRRNVGIVEQKPFLFQGTIWENIAKADPDLPPEKVLSAATIAGVREFSNRMPNGLETEVGEGGSSLSGGQAQRVAIARAIAREPGLLILDEATSALDTESEAAVQGNLDKLMKGRTALIIAHRLSTVMNADLIVVMDEGRIVETGDHASLMEKKGLYFYQAQASGLAVG